MAQIFKCEEHDSKASYFCIQPELQAKKRLACGECMLEGEHKDHQFLKIEFLQSQINILEQNCKKIPDSVLELKEQLKQFYEDIKNQFNEFIENWYYDLNQRIIKKTNPSQYISSLLTVRELDQVISKDKLTIIRKLQDPAYFKSIQPKELLPIFNLPLKKGIFDLNSYVDPCLCVLVGHRATVNSILYISENYLGSCGDDNQIIIWTKLKIEQNEEDIKLNRKSIAYKPKAFLAGHRDYVNQIIKNDENSILSCSNDGTIKIWDFQKNISKMTLRAFQSHHIYDMLKFNKEVLISGGSDKFINIWSLQNGQICSQLQGHQGDINTLCDLNTECIASGSADNTIIEYRDPNNAYLTTLLYIDQTIVTGNNKGFLSQYAK
ncbi:WD40-repeat-containing domain [Pseudocohnilembus persalinus]|uniref:WD40-repeat-containing domain n=1 Tax=Pseudocohnilembus persalinus TaxID=266149 RepID=A0A0V0QZV7_PSEPJ|nr:WD40-repeat-containing domain [Pseudocohnilembus persalinus]|eukprot:KRX07578.1 WD40-repeat-containing domain [Pseudocohnilembus persalinus]